MLPDYIVSFLETAVVFLLLTNAISAAAAIAAVRLLSLQSNFPLSHPASLLPLLPGSHAAGPVPPAGRIYSPRRAIAHGGMAT